VAVTEARSNSKLGRPTSRQLTLAMAYILLVLGSVAMLAPLVWLARSSFMGMHQIFIFPPEWVPDPWQWRNYPDALTAIPFFRYFLNTMTILVPSVLGTVITAVASAYSFSRLRWPGRDLVFGLLMTTLMLPYAVTLIPTFLLWARLGLVDTFWPLILPHWFGGGIFFIFLLRQFFRTLPTDLDEAAIIDGANPLQILWHIVVPLSRPAIVTVAIFATLNAWNDFLGPLIYLNSSSKYTLALGLNQFTGLYSSQWHLLMAAATVIVVPVIVLFFFAQRYFIEGIALTGTKG
jgi:multiple sugar transport system permease protein